MNWPFIRSLTFHKVMRIKFFLNKNCHAMSFDVVTRALAERNSNLFNLKWHVWVWNASSLVEAKLKRSNRQHQKRYSNALGYNYDWFLHKHSKLGHNRHNCWMVQRNCFQNNTKLYSANTRKHRRKESYCTIFAHWEKKNRITASQTKQTGLQTDRQTKPIVTHCPGLAWRDSS